MKINWAYLKKPSVIIGAVILFFILLFMLNRSGSSASGQTVVNSGPSDAQVASQTQLALAQIQAGLQGQAIQIDYAKSQDSNATALAVAQIQAALSGQQIVADRDVAAATIAANVHGMDLQYQGLLNQNATALAAAHEQYAYGLASQTITANTQLQLSQDQLAAFQFGTLANTISTLKSGKRDNAFALLTSGVYGISPTSAATVMAPNGSSGQSSSFLNFVSPVTSLM